MAQLIGNENGIKLWTLMAQSSDDKERDYVKQVSNAAQKYLKVWFSDLSTTMETKQNQAVYQMEWNGNDWVIDLFLLPENAKEKTDRLNNEL